MSCLYPYRPQNHSWENALDFWPRAGESRLAYRRLWGRHSPSCGHKWLLLCRVGSHLSLLSSQSRLARGREEWESAALQNANTKCNGLLPVWGPHVPESAFATCLAR